MTSLVQQTAPHDFLYPLNDLDFYPAAYDQLQNDDCLLAVQDLDSSDFNWHIPLGSKDKPDSNRGIMIEDCSDKGLTLNSSTPIRNKRRLAHILFSEHGRITRCDQCRLSNARCDQSSRCSRCVKFQIDCVYSETSLQELRLQRTMAKGAEDTHLISQAPSLAKKKRTRLAAPSSRCDECRLSHSKCDQKNPCSRCIKQQITCVYSKKPLRELELQRNMTEAAEDTSASTQAPTLSKKKKSRVLGCESCKRSIAKCDHTNPSSKCTKFTIEHVSTKTPLRELQSQHKSAKNPEEAPAFVFISSLTEKRINRVVSSDKHLSSNCDRCRISSAKCDQKQPCTRCKNYLIECVYSKKRLRELRLERKRAKEAIEIPSIPALPS